MRKLFLTALIGLSAIINSTAQIKKGSILLGGDLGFSSYKDDYNNLPEANTKNNTFSAGLSVAKAFRENRFWGVKISFRNQEQSYYSGSTPYTNELNSYGLGLFYSQYSLLLKKFYVFGEAGLQYHYGSSKYRDNLTNIYTNSRSNGAGLYITPGLSYAFCKKMHIQLTIPSLVAANYSHIKASNRTTSGFNISTGLSGNLLNTLGYGFRFIL